MSGSQLTIWSIDRKEQKKRFIIHCSHSTRPFWFSCRTLEDFANDFLSDGSVRLVEAISRFLEGTLPQFRSCQYAKQRENVAVFITWAWRVAKVYQIRAAGRRELTQHLERLIPRATAFELTISDRGAVFTLRPATPLSSSITFSLVPVEFAHNFMMWWRAAEEDMRLIMEDLWKYLHERNETLTPFQKEQLASCFIAALSQEDFEHIRHDPTFSWHYYYWHKLRWLAAKQLLDEEKLEQAAVEWLYICYSMEPGKLSAAPEVDTEREIKEVLFDEKQSPPFLGQRSEKQTLFFLTLQFSMEVKERVEKMIFGSEERGEEKQTSSHSAALQFIEEVKGMLLDRMQAFSLLEQCRKEKQILLRLICWPIEKIRKEFNQRQIPRFLKRREKEKQSLFRLAQWFARRYDLATAFKIIGVPYPIVFLLLSTILAVGAILVKANYRFTIWTVSLLMIMCIALFRPKTQKIGRLIARLVGGCVIGWLPIFTDEFWRLVPKGTTGNSCWLWAIPAMLIVVAFGYIVLEASGFLRNPLRTGCLIKRAVTVLLLGLILSALIGIPIVKAGNYAMLRVTVEDEIQCSIQVRQPDDPDIEHQFPFPAWGFHIPLALFIGLFVQILWEKEPLTEPI